MTHEPPRRDGEDDAPLADEGGPVPTDMPHEPEDRPDPPRPRRTEEQRAEPRPDSER